jgi:hypothetical protein
MVVEPKMVASPFPGDSTHGQVAKAR